MSEFNIETSGKQASRRWSRRLLAVLCLVVVLGLVRFGWPIVRQRQIVAELQAKGYCIQTDSVIGKWWDQRVQPYVGHLACQLIEIQSFRATGHDADLATMVELSRVSLTGGGDPPVFRILLQKSDVTDQGLGQLRGLHVLTDLAIEGKSLTDAGLGQLQDLPHLQALYLFNSPMVGDGLVHLQQLPALRWLCIEDVSITDASLVHLEKMPKLTTLRLAGTKVTAEGLAKLKQKLPSLKIDTTRLKLW